MSNEVNIFATTDRDGKFYGEHFIQSLESDLSNLEYADVASGEYQVWKYPSGEMYNLRPDREVREENYYSTPESSGGKIWEPQLIYNRTDKQMVEKAYKLLRSA